jgi:hypothetical protein
MISPSQSGHELDDQCRTSQLRLVLFSGRRGFPEANVECDHQTGTIDNEARCGDHGKARKTSLSEMDSDPTTAGNHERAACNG